MPILQTRLISLIQAAETYVDRFEALRNGAIRLNTVAMSTSDIEMVKQCFENLANQIMPISSEELEARVLIAQEKTHFKLSARNNELAQARMARSRATKNAISEEDVVQLDTIQNLLSELHLIFYNQKLASNTELRAEVGSKTGLEGHEDIDQILTLMVLTNRISRRGEGEWTISHPDTARVLTKDILQSVIAS